MVTKPTQTPTTAGEGGRSTQKQPRSRYDTWEDDSDSDDSGEEDWDSGPRMEASLAPHVTGQSGGFRSNQEALPESLRVGSAEHTPRNSAEMHRSASISPWLSTKNNPTGSMIVEESESSANPWEEIEKPLPAPPLDAPPPPPVPQGKAHSNTHAESTRSLIYPAHPPVQQFDDLAVNDYPTNPWGESLKSESLKTLPKRQPSKIEQEQIANQAWSSPPPPFRAAPTMPLQTALQLTPQREGSPEWDEIEPPNLENIPSHIPPVTFEQAQWDVTEKQRQADKAVIPPQASSSNLRVDDGWDTQGLESPVSPIDLRSQEAGIIQRGSVHSGIAQLHGPVPVYEPPPPTLPTRPSEQLPNLPPRPLDIPPQFPPRPTYDNANQSNTSITAYDSSSGARDQKKETYEIKKITWHDVNALSNPRISPILVQNVNGPCPLLALVNALTLSTAGELNTPLVEALRSREQISLNLLLEGVIDELLSGRRGDDSPDIMALHRFLIDLHTGMNVNPRFFPLPASNSPVDPRRSMTHVHPIDRESSIPGTFEETNETILYSAFGIPLIHGWLPDRNSPEFQALSRSAPTYEDAENIQFRQEELEEKFSLEGSLSFEEQGILEDIGEIKGFLSDSATQLTSHGIDVIQKSMMPGSFAVLFRNNHFGTVYRHPETHQLFQLVTDMGYAGHDEVVWESLADVNGENCEFFSGDFRLVGGVPSSPRQSGGEWETVPGRSNQGQGNSGRRATMNNTSIDTTMIASAYSQNLSSITSPTTEQEDADLALAMQLQEEEEQQHQSAQDQRRREAQLSQQYIEQEGVAASTASAANNVAVTARSGAARRASQTTPSRRASAMEVRPTIPPRRTGNVSTVSTASVIAASTPVRDPEAGIDAPPPSYELAATQPAYEPSPNHPAHPNASIGPGGVITGNNSPVPVRASAAASVTGRPQRRQSAYAANSSGQAGGVYGGRGPSYGESRPSGGGVAARRSGGNGQAGAGSSQQQQQMDRERDCVVM